MVYPFEEIRLNCDGPGGDSTVHIIMDPANQSMETPNNVLVIGMINTGQHRQGAIPFSGSI